MLPASKPGYLTLVGPQWGYVRTVGLILYGLYPVGSVQRVRFDQPGLSRIFCHIHPEMAAYIMVVDTPYFAVANERGQFTLPSVPFGEYRYHAWRPGGPTLDGTIAVNAATQLGVRWP